MVNGLIKKGGKGHMKTLFLMLTLLFALAACGRGSTDSPDDAYCELPYEASNDTVDYIPQTSSPPVSTEEPQYTTAPLERPPVPLPPPFEDVFEPLIPRWVEGDAFQPEHFLCDFNYLMHTLRLNFPIFGPAYRRRSIDVDRIEAATIQAILNNNPRTPEAFSLLLHRYFFSQFRHMGHLYQHWHERLHLVLANIYRYSMDEYGNIMFEYSRVIYEAMTAPAVVRFYGEIIVDLGEYESGMIIPRNVITSILVEGEVALISVGQFNHYNIGHDKEIVFAFFEEIADYAHLIIDLRQNPGGFSHYFYEIFVEPNITSPLEWQVFEFFSSGSNGRLFADAFIADVLEQNPDGLTVSDNAAAFVAENSMRYFNQDDLAMLQHVVTWHYRVDPTTEEKMFNGKIWILVGPRSASAVESVAIFARETGFATLVGEPTAGIMAAMSAYTLLPNSGILVRYDLGYMTCSLGRSFEEFGVMPHHFNRPGLTALHTVLALIEEGAY